MSPSKNFRPVHVRDLQAGVQIKVSGTETYSVLRSIKGSVWEGNFLLSTEDGRTVTRHENALVKVLVEE